MDEKERNEKLGRAVVGIGWFIFAAKFLIITTILAGIILYFLGKPLWVAPIISVCIFIIYRVFWGLIWKFIEWASKQK